MEQMNVPIDPNDPESVKVRLRGTSGGESNNKVINRLMRNIGRQGPKLGYMKFMLRAHRWNIDIDRRFKLVLSIKEPRTLEWYLHKALRSYCASHGRMVYPPEFTLSDEFNVDKGWEPIGTYHGRYSRWQEVEEKVQIPMQVESESLSATDDPESTTTSTSAATSPPPPPAQNSPPTAAAPSASSSSPPSSSPQPQWNTAHGRKGDTASPASSCYRRLGGHMPTATALNVYHPDNVPLSELQHETFWRIVIGWETVHRNRLGTRGTDRQAQEVADSWKHGHLQMIRQNINLAGYGGLIRAQHAKKLLLASGMPVLQSQMHSQAPFQGMTLMPPLHSVQPINNSAAALQIALAPQHPVHS